MQLNTVIFDMDGLLIDSEPCWQQAGMETLREFNGWLFVGGNESPKGIMISRDVDGYDEIRTQLTARCPLTSAPRTNPFASILPL